MIWPWKDPYFCFLLCSPKKEVPLVFCLSVCKGFVPTWTSLPLLVSRCLPPAFGIRYSSPSLFSILRDAAPHNGQSSKAARSFAYLVSSSVPICSLTSLFVGVHLCIGRLRRSWPCRASERINLRFHKLRSILRSEFPRIGTWKHWTPTDVSFWLYRSLPGTCSLTHVHRANQRTSHRVWSFVLSHIQLIFWNRHGKKRKCGPSPIQSITGSFYILFGMLSSLILATMLNITTVLCKN